MPARYVEVPASEMEALMAECGFERKLIHGVVERAYQRRRTTRGESKSRFFAVRVYSSVVDDAGRDVGTDAIRVQLLFVEAESSGVWNGRAPALVEKIMFSAPRVHRTQGWREKTRTRMREAWAAVDKLSQCPQCARPMVERKTRLEGRPFLGCVSYPRCRGTRSLAELDPDRKRDGAVNEDRRS